MCKDTLELRKCEKLKGKPGYCSIETQVMRPGDSMPSPFLYLLLLSSASGRWLGQTWGGAFKPIGINTIINK